MPTLPSLTALRCFDAAAQEASFTRAAERVHLTQGAVSHQVLALEAQLGVTLFLRRRSGLQLTDAGRAYWNEVSTALRQLERATQDVVTHQGRGGSLNLSVASSLASYWLVPRLSSFVQAHPDITLNLSTRIGPVDFAVGKEDAAIEYCGGATDGLQAVRVLPLRLRPYAAPALVGRRSAGRRGLTRTHMLQLLDAHPLIRHTTVPECWAGWLAVAGLDEAVRPEHLLRGPQLDLLSMALNAAIAGLGMALLPRYVADHAEQTGRLVCLHPAAWESAQAYHLRYPHWKTGLAALQRFQDWLLTQDQGE